MAIGVTLVAVVIVRVLTEPLRRLAAAADTIGQTTAPRLVAEDGPTEVQHVASAFNRMQRRIHHLVEDRTQALAAVSHDLRTPITRLRLRAGFLADREMQAKIDADLDEMESMISATLTYLSGDSSAEERRTINVAATLETLVGEAVDAGHVATYAGPPHVPIDVRPVALKRALTNLISNAIKHGGSAAVELRISDDTAIISISDEGPGIPAELIERAFEPFVRLDQSRNRETGGAGLGLTIARQAIAAEGGDLTLHNRPTGGLIATVSLALHAKSTPP
ncbi:MAG: HAMP domain-containing protein [Alphaproteobacteria bacterium]|nr:HAMP domain-containing protein [Alphaproteobacteria bacterium]